jgi:hypothetical protein
MFTTTRRNKDIATAVLNGATYLDVGILCNISWERAFQITRKLCLHVEATGKHNIREFRQRANEIILKIEAIPEA